ncbi:hypothetical protein XENOCAPTIV_019994 [Xenoophorus captivus]|uniref:Uncharacterized protein n=1 Tax=Xenoophorus captivus TaxID=1517983 RepID=A0ABV0SAW2_9TELE
MGKAVLTQAWEVKEKMIVVIKVTTSSRAVRVVLKPGHDVLQVSTVAAALTPHKEPLHHMVAHCTSTGTLATPGGEKCVAGQSSFH